MRLVGLLSGMIAGACLTSPALAQSTDLADFSLSATTGADYSSGDYGAQESTGILVVPLALRATTGDLAFNASVPYIRIDGPGGVVVGPDGEQLPGLPTDSGVRKGFGDLNLGASYTLGEIVQFTASGRVKLPTSSERDQLSTGETDYTIKGELAVPVGPVIPYASVGYRFLGDPEEFDLRNGPTASVGLSASIGGSVLLASYDYARAISSLSEDSHSLFGGLSVPVATRLNLTGYGVAGLSEGSPDVGVGLLVTAQVF